MSYCKKIIILSQITRNTGGTREATGIVKLERIGGRVTGRAAIFNIPASGLYLGIKCKNLPLQSFVITDEPETALSLHSASDIEDCVCVVAKDTAAGFAPVLSGTAGKKGFSEELLYSFVRNTTQNLDKKSPIYKDSAPAIFNSVRAESGEAINPPVKEEQVSAISLSEKLLAATESSMKEPMTIIEPPVFENDFDGGESMRREIFANKEEVFPRGGTRFEDAVFSAENFRNPSATRDDDSIAVEKRQAFNPQASSAEETAAVVDTPSAPINDEQIATENYYDFYKEAAAARAPERRAAANHKYYREISAELEDLFSSFPPETTLAEIIEGSYFARINYVGDKYYAVGLISSGDEPQYICYAVPGEYSSEPPAELKDSCRWMPAKYSDFTGAGYWVMYQDTDTGATITDI